MKTSGSHPSPFICKLCSYNPEIQILEVPRVMDIRTKLENQSFCQWSRQVHWKEIPTMIFLRYFFQIYLFFEDFIYLFLDRREGREKERKRSINVWLSLTGDLPGLQPRHVPRLGIKPVTPWFAGQYSIH